MSRLEPVTGLPLARMPDPQGIIQPLRDRIQQLEREYESMTRTAQQEIQRLQTENARLKMALDAISPPMKIEP